MSIVLEADHSKKRACPSYSSRHYSVTVEHILIAIGVAAVVILAFPTATKIPPIVLVLLALLGLVLLQWVWDRLRYFLLKHN
jgi:hypothetical protein